MTAIAHPFQSRPVQVQRALSLAWQGIAVWLLLIVGGSFAINLVIAGIIRAQTTEPSQTTGGVASAFILAFVFGTQTVWQYMRFAAGMGVTRRDFVAGAALDAVVVALGLGTLLVGLALAERATAGWGLGLGFFLPGAIDGLGLGLLWAGLVLVTLASTLAGLACGALYVRWRSWGLLVPGLFWVLVVAGLTLVGTLQGWDVLLERLGDVPAPVAVLAVPLAVAGACTWLAQVVLRRAPA